jgi:AraC-like DNA-binding protein
MNKVSQRYEFEHHRQEKIATQKLDIERQRLSIRISRTIIASLSVICLLLLAIVIIVIHNRRRLSIKNRDLVHQILEQDRIAEELERERQEKQKMRALLKSANKTAPEETNENELFYRLQTLMKDPAVYLDANISRKAIANRLGTNEKYLHDALVGNTGKGFSEYLNSVRLFHARELLSRSDNSDTVDTVAVDSGFSSRTTFYRLFRAQYGLSPVEFRKLVRK